MKTIKRLLEATRGWFSRQVGKLMPHKKRIALVVLVVLFVTGLGTESYCLYDLLRIHKVAAVVAIIATVCLLFVPKLLGSLQAERLTEKIPAMYNNNFYILFTIVTVMMFWGDVPQFDLFNELKKYDGVPWSLFTRWLHELLVLTGLRGTASDTATFFCHMLAINLASMIWELSMIELLYHLTDKTEVKSRNYDKELR